MWASHPQALNCANTHSALALLCGAPTWLGSAASIFSQSLIWAGAISASNRCSRPGAASLARVGPAITAAATRAERAEMVRRMGFLGVLTNRQLDRKGQTPQGPLTPSVSSSQLGWFGIHRHWPRWELSVRYPYDPHRRHLNLRKFVSGHPHSFAYLLDFAPPIGHYNTHDLRGYPDCGVRKVAGDAA